MKCNFKQDLYKIEIDGKEFNNPGKGDVNTLLLMLFNGKYTGAGKLVDPFAIMNDGLIDVTWIH